MKFYVWLQVCGITFRFLIHFNFGQQLTSGFVQVRRTEKQSAAIHFSALFLAGQATLNSKS
jgi:hypothetical protein